MNALPYVIRAKIRGFARRSVFAYAIASALIAYAIHTPSLKSIATVEYFRTWVIYFLLICTVALTMNLISAVIQSRRLIPRQVTFKQEAITITHRGNTECKTWDWIIAAEELGDSFPFVVQRFPRLELFLSKKRLSEDEYRSLRAWLVEHGKLPPRTRAA